MWIVPILFLGFSAQSAEIHFPNYPKDRGAGCTQTAQWLASEVQRTAGGIANGDCLRKKWSSYDIRVRYDGDTVTPSPAWAVYGTLSECRGRLKQEQDWWEKQTGLSAFHAYCSLDVDDSNFDKKQKRYSPRFFAVGESTGVTEVYKRDIQANRVFGNPNLFKDIVRLSRQEGLPARQAWIAGGVFNSQLLIRFSMPASSPLLGSMRRRYDLKSTIENFTLPDLFEEADPMRFRRPAECTAQMERAKKMMAPYWGSPVVWFCGWTDSLFRAELFHLRINTTEESFERIRAGRDDGAPFSNRYGTHGECEADKARVVKYYRDKYGADQVPGALCSYRKTSYQKNPVQVFVYVKRT